MRIPVDPNPGTCFSCGVRTDVDCRHRMGVAMPTRIEATTPTVDRRTFHNAWARQSGTMGTKAMTEQLMAMLTRKLV